MTIYCLRALVFASCSLVEQIQFSNFPTIYTWTWGTTSKDRFSSHACFLTIDNLKKMHFLQLIITFLNGSNYIEKGKLVK